MIITYQTQIITYVLGLIIAIVFAGYRGLEFDFPSTAFGVLFWPVTLAYHILMALFRACICSVNGWPHGVGMGKNP